MPSPAQPGNTKFTVLIRLPFPRRDFVDPPPVDWNAAKDQALWDILSRPSKGNDIDWKALAERFEVTLQFLLQQAAWLYDRQLSQVRAQMRKVGNTHSNTASPAPGSIHASTTSGQPPKTGQSSNSRAPSRLASQSKETPQLRAPMPRRTSSGTTVQQIKAREASHPGTPTLDPNEPRLESHGRRPSTSRREQPPVAVVQKSPALEEEDLTSSSSDSNSDEDESDDAAGQKGLGFKRFGRFSAHRSSIRDDDDDDESPAFLPLSRGHESASHGTTGHDLSTTLRMDQDGFSARQRQGTDPQDTRKSMTTESSESSVSSGVPANHSHNQRRNQLNHHRRTADLARMNSRRSTTSGRDLSDGTPSMGSSFSDLDGDTSVTQSMLEEALMSNMQHGGMASRMSTISQAFRSRYLG
ncbi:hypothetical protein BDV18DRAFT_161226 [Aspergillus unguis]